MKTAASYTAGLRVQAQATNTKVQYPMNMVVNSNPIYASITCSPSFVPIAYNPKPNYGCNIITNFKC